MSSFASQVRTLVAFFRLRFFTRKKLILIASNTGQLTGNALGLAVAAKESPDFVPVFIGKVHVARPIADPLGIDLFGKQGRLAKMLWDHADVIAQTSYYRQEFGMGEFKRFKLLLWHGMPMKGIGVFDPKTRDNPEEDCDLAIATSRFTAKIMSDSFRIPLEQVLVVGEPKTDVIPDNCCGWDWSRSLKKQYSTVIAYMPTWREKLAYENGQEVRRGDDEAMANLLNGLMRDPQLNALLKEHNAAFVIRMHAFNKGGLLPIEAPFYRMDNSDGEAAHLLENADIFVGDYSSLIIDALLFDKPIVMWCEDYAEYTKLRSFPYFDLKETFGWAIQWSQKDLVQWLAERLNKKPLSEPYQQAYARCKKQFHQHDRGGAGERILESVRKALAK